MSIRDIGRAKGISILQKNITPIKVIMFRVFEDNRGPWDDQLVREISQNQFFSTTQTLTKPQWHTRL